MRENKFRAKRMTDHKWVYGVPVKSVNGKFYMIHGATEDAINTFNDVDFFFTEIIEDTIGQQTELKDVNGKEIFEDDILRVGKSRDTYAVVKWRNGGFKILSRQAWTTTNRGEIDNMEYAINNKFEIVGNIYDKQPAEEK